MHPGTGKSAFTIIELLVGSAITAILAGLMFMITISITDSWKRLTGALSANSQAQLVLDTLAHDLQGAVYHNDGGIWLAVDLPDGTSPRSSAGIKEDLNRFQNWVVSGPRSVQIKPTGQEDSRSLNLSDPDLSHLRFGFSGAWLRFFTTPWGSPDSSISAVSYQIVRRNVTGSPPGPNNPSEIRYMFFRSMVRPNHTLEAGFDLTPAPGVPYYSPNGQDGHPGNVIRPNNARVIANNVIDFGVRLYVQEETGLMLVFPQDTAEQRPFYYAGLDSGHPFPDIAEVFVRILTDDGARQIQNLEAGRTRGDWWQIAEAHSRIFSQRIDLRNRGL